MKTKKPSKREIAAIRDKQIDALVSCIFALEDLRQELMRRCKDNDDMVAIIDGVLPVAMAAMNMGHEVTYEA